MGGTRNAAGEGGRSPAGGAGRDSGTGARAGSPAMGGMPSGGSPGSGGTLARAGAPGAGAGAMNSAGRPSSAGSGGMGATGGSSSGAKCDADSAVAEIAHTEVGDVQSNDCVALVLNPTWSSVNITIEGGPGSSGYPIPFSYSICNGKSGTGTLTANYQKVQLFMGANPKCDVFVQLEGAGTPLKLIHYD